MHEYVSTPDSVHAFIVVYTDYTQAISRQRVCETFSAGRQDLGHAYVRLNGVVGCQVVFEDENHSFIATGYVVGRRVYQVLAIMPLNSEASVDVARFFMSFNFSRPNDAVARVIFFSTRKRGQPGFADAQIRSDVAHFGTTPAAQIATDNDAMKALQRDFTEPASQTP
jgi:hypothetical protein